MEAPNQIEAHEAQKDLDLFDRNLRLVWNPNAHLATPGCFDAYGAPQAARYAGRWQVVVKGKLDGEDTVVHTLGAESGTDKPYRAPGPWLVTFMREWDAANVQFAESLKRIRDEEERARVSADTELYEKGEEELHRFATEHGARELIGRGAQFIN